MFLQPPVVPSYPSLTTAFAQSIADVVGRSRKSEAIRVLQEFNVASQDAERYMNKSIQFATMQMSLWPNLTMSATGVSRSLSLKLGRTSKKPMSVGEAAEEY
jgi:hypothetical protein